MARLEAKKMYKQHKMHAVMLMLILMMTDAIALSQGAYGASPRLGDLEEREFGEEEVVSIWRRSSLTDGESKGASLVFPRSPLTDIWDMDGKASTRGAAAAHTQRFQVRLERQKSLEPTSLFYQIRQYVKGVLVAA